ncbi:MAG TPA: Holliday junction resolvase RuvX [Pirellulaceae bacterium]
MAAGRIAGIDFGTKRIGIAVTDPERILASPWAVWQRTENLADEAEYFRRLVADEGIQLFVVGLPVHLSGDESRQSHQARTFGAWLGDVTGIPVTYFDERYSSSQAESLLGQAELTRQKRKLRRDMLAAQILLTAYLESGSPDTAHQAPIEGESREL